MGEPDRAFVCPECGRWLPLDALLEDARSQLDAVRRAERHYLTLALALMVIFAVVAWRQASPVPLLAAVLLALILVLLATFLRYRHWQITHERLFEHKAPLRDWIRDEMRR